MLTGGVACAHGLVVTSVASADAELLVMLVDGQALAALRREVSACNGGLSMDAARACILWGSVRRGRCRMHDCG